MGKILEVRAQYCSDVSVTVGYLIGAAGPPDVRCGGEGSLDLLPGFEWIY